MVKRAYNATTGKIYRTSTGKISTTCPGCEYEAPDGTTYSNSFGSTLDSGWVFDKASNKEARTNSGELQIRQKAGGGSAGDYFRRQADMSSWTKILFEANVNQATSNNTLWGINIGTYSTTLGGEFELTAIFGTSFRTRSENGNLSNTGGTPSTTTTSNFTASRNRRSTTR